MRPSGVGVVVCAVALIYILLLASTQNGYDFRAFYCAGAVARAGENPYLTEPLHYCEAHRTDAAQATVSNRTAVPAPLPGYDIAFFEGMSFLPYGAAAKLWTGFLLLALFGTVWLASNLSRHTLDMTTVSLTLSLALASVLSGQLMPIVVLAICAAAWCLRHDRAKMASVCAICTLSEPHIGLGICAALALWVPRTRYILGVGCVLLALVSVLMIGIAANIEYISQVLPYHALSEAGSDYQLSLFAVLYALGMRPEDALRVATLQYILLGILSVFVARAVARRCKDDSYLALIPPAFAVTGGVFLHVTQMAAAIPLALLMTRMPSPYRGLAVTSLLLLAAAVPRVETVPLAILTALFVIWLAWDLIGSMKYVAATAVFSVLLIAIVYWHAAPRGAANHVLAAIPNRYPESSWAREVATYMSSNSVAAWLKRVPSWAAVLLLVSTTSSVAFRAVSPTISPSTTKAKSSNDIGCN